MANIKKKQTRTVLKRSAAVAVSGKLSKKARVVYNLLLDRTRRAIKYDSTQSEFKAPVNEILSNAQIDNDSWSYAKNILKSIQSAYLEKDTLGVDGSGEWFMENLIVSSSIKDGMMKWGMSPNMLRLIRDTRNPEEHIHPYVLVDLVIQTNFDKHGLTLYELGLHWLPRKASKSRSGWLDLDTIRDLFNVNYPIYGKLNQEVLQKAIASVNDIANGSPFTVELDTKKVGKAICYVQFTLERRQIIEDGIIDIENPQEVIEGILLSAGLHPKTIEDLLQKMEESGKLSTFERKTIEISGRYLNKKGDEKVKLITAALNSELAQISLPFSTQEKATPHILPNEQQLDWSAKKCFADKGEECKFRQTGYAATSSCSRCFEIFKRLIPGSQD